MKNAQFLISVIVITLVLTNCISYPTEKTPTNPAQMATNTPPNIVPTSRPTRIRDTSTAIPSPTWTPLATLSSDEAEQFISNLLESNRGCKLPCWWGIVPGQTRWDEAEQFFSTFATEIGQGQEGFEQEDDGYHHYTNYSMYYTIPGQPTDGRTLYDVRDGVIVFISVDSTGNEISYQLHRLLSSYGQPQSVYILTYPNVPFDILPFRILVHYPDQGIYAIYEYPAENDGTTISSCPNSSGPSLYLDSPNQPYEKYLTPFEDSAKRLMGVNEGDPLVNLQTATQMDVETFYETFKDPKTDMCLKTPANLWH